MNRFRRLRHLGALLTAGGALLLNAAEPAKPAPPAVIKSANPDALVLPTVAVTSSRIRELDTAIRKLDKLIAREQKKMKSTELDRALNNSKIASAAAIFGGNSASHLAAVAATRVSLMETERTVLESMKLPRTLESLAALEAELEQLRTTRRNLDNAPAQR